MSRGKGESLTLMEAVDNLSSMAEVESTTTAENGAQVKWLDPTKKEENKVVIKQTFKVLNNYLHDVFEKENEQLKDLETQRGIQAIMVLAGEAAQKMDKFTGLFKGAHGEESVSELTEYKDLQRFYLTKIMNRFQEVLEMEESWEKEWGGIEEEQLGIEKRGLKDLETVRRDKDYELFYIKKENQKPFFNRSLLRHIRLVGDFDEIVKDSQEESPFSKIEVLQDKDIHLAAKDIIKQSLVYIDAFYKEAMRHKDLEFVTTLNKALMALMLTANPRNLKENTTHKCCLNYFRDFHQFLRLALSSFEYARYLTTFEKQSGKFSHALINLSHALCCFLYTRIDSRKEALVFIHRLIRKGEEKLGLKTSNANKPFWNILLDEDESIRAFLKTYPNGPLLKTLDVLREEDQKQGFDPLLQGNLPSQLFEFTLNTHETSVLRMPSPTRQLIIDKAEPIEEFGGYLRYLNERFEGENHLLFNLQDRTSWQEHARCQALEDMQKQTEFSQSLTVITLAKNTDFYHQSGEYTDLEVSEQFFESFKGQIEGGEECGFSFPHQLKGKELSRFTEEAFKLIHKHFFGNKSHLTRKDRLDFIEVFYLLFEIKAISLFTPDSLSFTCKDAVDTGVGASVSFYAFLKMLSPHSLWKGEEKDFVLWMLYSPSLWVRERAIDPQTFNRTISLLAHLNIEIEAHKKEVLKALEGLYGKELFGHLSLII